VNQRETANLVMEALAHAVSGDSHGAATTLQTIGQNSDGNAMYGVCCALAAAGEHAMRRLYGDQAPQPGSGDLWVMEKITPGAMENDPAKAFALRFLISYANRDTATCLALYSAAWNASDDEYVASVAALLNDVAGITRLALDRQKGDQS